jgi:DNA-binding MarR family transcriptional regulator
MSTTAPPSTSLGGAASAVDSRQALADLACTNTALRKAARRLGLLYDEALAPTGLKATQVGMLTQIELMTTRDADGSPIGPALQGLATELVLHLSGLTHALRPLVRDGLVRLEPDPADRRTKHVVLTDDGRALHARAVTFWAQANGRVEAVMGVAAAATLRGLADQVASPEFLDAYGGAANQRSKRF